MLQRRESGRRPGQGGDRAGPAGICGLREDLGFYPEGGGNPEGLWAEEGQDPSDIPKSSRSRSWGPGRWLFPFV